MNKKELEQIRTNLIYNFGLITIQRELLVKQDEQMRAAQDEIRQNIDKNAQEMTQITKNEADKSSNLPPDAPVETPEQDNK